MKIWKYLSANKIFLDIQAQNKENLIRFIAKIPEKSGYEASADEVAQRLMNRENTMSTGIGRGVAIPHADHPNIAAPLLVLIRPESPIDFNSIDHEPVDIVFGLIMPEGKTHLHIQILAGISRVCKNPAFLDAVRSINDPVKLLDNIRALENEMAFH
jgi:mannitol/fructose-specific phosphotransferase system IIA component (Ntr-type)